MQHRIITLASAGLVLLLALLGRALLPGAGAAQAQQPTAAPASPSADPAIVQQLSALNSKTDQLVQAMTQLNGDSAQSLQELQGVGKQTGRIADRLELHTITAVGYVEVQAAPDQATVQIDVKTLAPTLDAAIAQNKRDTDAMKSRIGGAPIRVADPQIAPVFGDERKIESYRVLTPLLITIADPGGAGAKTLAQVVALGGSSFKEIKYSVSDAAARKAQDDARAQAFQRAKEHADAYAAKAGGSIGAIETVSEDLNVRTFQQPPLPGQPTEQVFSAEISVMYELKLP